MNRCWWFFRVLVLGGFVLGVSETHADDAWIEPERLVVTPGATLALAAITAETFDAVGTTIPAERVARALGRISGAAVNVSAPVTVSVPATGEKTRSFFVTLPRPGVAALAFELKAQAIEREADTIESYLRQIHAGDELRTVWEALPPPRRWRELHTRHTKVFVRVGEPAASDRGWVEPVGLALEIVPERDPTMLRAGEAFPVRVLRSGEPLAGLTVAFASAGETHEHVVVTDEHGRASATPGISGLWLVRGTLLRRGQESNREWDSDTATMLFRARD